jgi:hypothetical protein
MKNRLAIRQGKKLFFPDFDSIFPEIFSKKFSRKDWQDLELAHLLGAKIIRPDLSTRLLFQLNTFKNLLLYFSNFRL